jgi:hypothetical protein
MPSEGLRGRALGGACPPTRGEVDDVRRALDRGGRRGLRLPLRDKVGETVERVLISAISCPRSSVTSSRSLSSSRSRRARPAAVRQALVQCLASARRVSSSSFSHVGFSHRISAPAFRKSNVRLLGQREAAPRPSVCSSKTPKSVRSDRRALARVDHSTKGRPVRAQPTAGEGRKPRRSASLCCGVRPCYLPSRPGLRYAHVRPS